MGSPETTDAKLILVDRPGAPQTTLVCFSMGLARSTPDYAPVEVMNTDLGGLFSSRINMNLREAHGYTYGAFSFFIVSPCAGAIHRLEAMCEPTSPRRRRRKCSTNCGACERRR